MGWKQFEDSYDNDDSKGPNTKPRKNPVRESIDDEEDNSHKKKRSSIRSHRKKTHKDQFWEENP
jgi:hypothetical protein